MNKNICICIDDSYLPFGLVTIYSVIRFNSGCKFYILSNKLLVQSKEKILKFSQKYQVEIKIIELEENQYNVLEARGHISKATYLRFAIPRLLPNLEKVLYLDADIVVNGSLDEYFEIDISKYGVAAVENPFFSRHVVLGLSPSSKYFNAGVLMINNVYWNKNDLEKVCLEWLSNNNDIALMNDQDALNVILKDDWCEVDYKWNFQSILIHLKSKIDSGRYQRNYEDVRIIHYSTKHKPWQFSNIHPLKHLFVSHYNELKDFLDFPKINQITFYEVLKRVKKRMTNGF
jgi:lipopolysaccharide biosynthesis glycosyltransferase